MERWEERPEAAPTAQRLHKDAMRDILGPALRAHGCKGTAPHWQRWFPNGDLVWLSVQSRVLLSTIIHGGLAYTVNWSYFTAPGVAYIRHKFPPQMAKRFDGHCGIVNGRIPTRRYPHTNNDPQWRRITTANEATRAMTDVVEQFEDDVWPSILKLNDPSTCLREAERTRPHVFPHPTLRLQLAATGALPDFDQTAAEYLAASDERSAENNQRYVAFLRAWVEDRRARSRIDEN